MSSTDAVHTITKALFETAFIPFLSTIFILSIVSIAFLVFKETIRKFISRIFNTAAKHDTSYTMPDSNNSNSTHEQDNLNSAICPLCGAKLVLRTARKGQNAGQQFWGCSSFPNCRYTKNID